MIREDEEWTEAQAWGCPCHPKIYPRSTGVKAWGCPSHPLLHQQKKEIKTQMQIWAEICQNIIAGKDEFFGKSSIGQIKNCETNES